MKRAFQAGKRRAVHAWAPGRINLIGEHTDYNGGYVLPLALPLKTHAVALAREDRQAFVTSLKFGGGDESMAYRLGAEERTGSWVDYVQGVTRMLEAGGRPIPGFEMTLSGDVPMGSGLSSSASLEVAVLRALRGLFALDLDDLSLALLAQRAEREFVGANVGMMDQMAASLGDERHALFIDTATLAYERIHLPPEAAWIVVNSGIVHRHAGGEYNRRREECARAARALGVTLLCRLDPADMARIEALPPPLNARARHAVTESRRVTALIQALRQKEFSRAGILLRQSHDSLRDDYEVSVPEIDFLVDTLQNEPAIYGARMTGGGFGGCVIALARPGAGMEAAGRTVALYRRRFGLRAEAMLEIIPSPAAYPWETHP